MLSFLILNITAYWGILNLWKEAQENFRTSLDSDMLCVLK